MKNTVVYVSYNTLSELGESEGIGCYEVAAPNPVKGFLYNTLKEKFGLKEDEMLVKRLMMEKAGKKVILMDSSKCGKILPYTFGNIENADCIVSDGGLPREFLDRAEQAGVRVL